MQLGIEGKWALVCAASKGLGKGCAQALAREGVNVVITARGAEALQATAAHFAFPSFLTHGQQIWSTGGAATYQPRATPWVCVMSKVCSP